MDIGAILLAMALLILVASYLARPLTERRLGAATEEHSEISSLLAEQERILALIDELEMDRAMKKISASDYQSQRSAWIEEGAGVLRRLDELGLKPAAVAEGPTSALESRLEAEIATLRDDLKERDRVRFCPTCGHEIIPGDRFCTECGASLEEIAIT
jgi:hypothetical protein